MMVFTSDRSSDDYFTRMHCCPSWWSFLHLEGRDQPCYFLAKPRWQFSYLLLHHTYSFLVATWSLRSHNWKCTEDQSYFKRVVGTKHVFKLLMGLNKSFDEDCGRILGTKPILGLCEVCFKVCREESHRHLML